MTHLKPVELISTVENLDLKEEAIYYIGALAYDADVKERGKLISATAMIARELYDEGIITLKTRKLKEGEYEYIMRKRRIIKVPFQILAKARQLEEKYGGKPR